MAEIMLAVLIIVIAAVEFFYYRLMHAISEVQIATSIANAITIVLFIIFKDSFDETSFFDMILNLGFIHIVFIQLIKICLISFHESSYKKISIFFAMLILILSLLATTLIS